MRGGGEIGGAERGLVAVLAEQLLDARAIGAGRRAEDAGEPRAIVVGEARRSGKRVLVVVLVAPGDQPHCRVDQRDLRREQVAEQAGDAPGDIDARASHRGAAAAPRCR